MGPVPEGRLEPTLEACRADPTVDALGSTLVMRSRVAVRNVDALIVQVLEHADGAWPRLCAAIEPDLVALLRRPHFFGDETRNEGQHRKVASEILTALGADDFVRLRSFMAARRRNPGLPFFAWLAVVAKRLWLRDGGAP